MPKYALLENYTYRFSLADLLNCSQPTESSIYSNACAAKGVQAPTKNVTATPCFGEYYVKLKSFCCRDLINIIDSNVNKSSSKDEIPERDVTYHLI